jgi:pyruvate-formate lyase-activating enzyme
MKALLIMPPFWDPVCVPLGISSLKAYAERFKHTVDLFDFNTLPEVFTLQHRYFELGKRMFPRWQFWNIERNGTEMLAMHQILYLFARNRPDYHDLVAEVLNLAGDDQDTFRKRVDCHAFDALFRSLYTEVEKHLGALIRKNSYDVIGCSLFNSTWPSTLFITAKVKTTDPRVRTVVGGPGPLMGIMAAEGEVRSFFETHTSIDYLVVGEGEEPFLKILENPGEPRGILQAAATAVGGRLSAIDDLPLPDYGDLQVSRYLQLSVATSRGCPFECSFCAETVFWRGFTRVKPVQAFEMLRAIANKHGRFEFYLCDSLANQVISPLTRDIAASGLPFKLDCYLRADPICCDAKRAAEWRKGGLYRARLGMESASQRILDAMVKKTTPDQMSQSLSALTAAGVMTSTLWIIGYPGETEKEFEETLRFIADHRDLVYQADAWLMQYHRTGLAGSDSISRIYNSQPRYSEALSDVLKVVPTFIQGDLLPRERFARLERFVEAMAIEGIPNPYTVFHWLEADKRWRNLGRNAGWGIDDMVVAMNA